MSVRRSTYFAFGSRYANILVNFIASVIIARLLTPGELGIFAVSLAFVTLSQIVRDFGIGNYLIQERELNRDRIRAAMGIGLVIGACLALLIITLAGAVAGFYGEPGVAEVLYILAAIFFLMSPNSIGLSLLRRDLDFGRLFWFEMISNLGGATIAVSLAYLGQSYRSLAWGSLAGALILLVFFLTFRRDLVLIRPSLRQWRRVTGFGSIYTAANLVTHLGMMSPTLIMGRMLGFSDVAFYNRGNSLTRMFRDTIESGARAVALPAFAANLRQRAFNKEGYLYTIALITGISWPFFGVLALMAYPIIKILYGDQWDAAVPVVQLLAIGNIVNALSVLGPEAMIAVGAVKIVLYKALAVQGTRIALVVLCSFHSFEAVAAAQIVVYLESVAINQFFLRRLVGLTFGDVMRASKRSFAVTIASTAGPMLVAVLYPPSADLLWPPLLLALVTGAIGWLAAVFAVDHPARNEISILFRKTRSVVAALPHRV